MCSRTAGSRGAAGERIAAAHPISLRHELLARNLRHPAAELDIVSQTRTHLVITEVKTSANPTCDLEGRFSFSARARQRLAARELGLRFDKPPRLDLIEVLMNTKTGGFSLKHHLGI